MVEAKFQGIDTGRVRELIYERFNCKHVSESPQTAQGGGAEGTFRYEMLHRLTPKRLMKVALYGQSYQQRTQMFIDIELFV